MAKQKRKLIEKLLFEVYEKGLQMQDCNLTDYYEKIMQALNIPLVSKCKPTGYEKNNLPIDIRHAYCEAVEIYQQILNYENGIINKDEFIKEVEDTKRKH